MEMDAVGLGAVAEGRVGEHRPGGQQLGRGRHLEAFVVPVVDVQGLAEEAVGGGGRLDPYIADLVQPVLVAPDASAQRARQALAAEADAEVAPAAVDPADRKSTRLNSSH